MKDTSSKEKSKDKGSINIAMEIVSKDSGNMTRNILVSITIKTEEFLRASSTKEKCHMELWSTPMDKATKDSFKMGKDMVLVFIATLSEPFYFKVNGLRMNI